MGGRGGGGHGGTTDDAQIHGLYKTVQESWGGATINQTTGEEVPQGADKYAVATTDTTSIPENASFSQFKEAYGHAQDEHSSSPYIGIFHDDEKGTIDFNGATVVDSKAEVDALYNAGNPIPGGAYHFKTGDGYWPQGTPVQYNPDMLQTLFDHVLEPDHTEIIGQTGKTPDSVGKVFKTDNTISIPGTSNISQFKAALSKIQDTIDPFSYIKITHTEEGKINIEEVAKKVNATAGNVKTAKQHQKNKTQAG